MLLRKRKQKKQPAAKAEQFFDSTFVGILPAADAPGINTRLTLNADYTFSCTQQGLGKVSDVFKETGKWNLQRRKKYSCSTIRNGNLL
ncbi:copper resistance protein NlpE N-terminal domain-containing protein [Treponema phagedenis]|nr:copper resistance protein NlpE N-terminal domain-containing protein [Treponema phagedenis]